MVVKEIICLRSVGHQPEKQGLTRTGRRGHAGRSQPEYSWTEPEPRSAACQCGIQESPVSGRVAGQVGN